MHAVSDYTPLIEEVVTFESSETFKSVMVSIQADNVFEGSESFTVVLSLLPGSNGTEIGQQNTATTTITDGRHLNEKSCIGGQDKISFSIYVGTLANILDQL